MTQKFSDVVRAIGLMCTTNLNNSEIAHKVGLTAEDVVLIRDEAAQEEIPVSADDRVKLELSKRLTSPANYGLFARVRIATHCGRDYNQDDQFCTVCGQELQFPSAIEELLEYLEERVETSQSSTNIAKREQWVEIVRQLDVVAKKFDVLRHQEPPKSHAVGADAIKMGKLTTRLRNVLIREQLLRFADIENGSATAFMKLQNFGNTTLSELKKHMRQNSRDMDWVDR